MSHGAYAHAGVYATVCACALLPSLCTVCLCVSVCVCVCLGVCVCVCVCVCVLEDACLLMLDCVCLLYILCISIFMYDIGIYMY